MSLKVLVRHCKPSVLVRAVRALYPSLPETGWETLDVIDKYLLTKGQGNLYTRYEKEYGEIQERLTKLRRVRSLFRWFGGRQLFPQDILPLPMEFRGVLPALYGSEEFLNRDIGECEKQLACIEAGVTPRLLTAFFQSQFGKDKHRGALIPGRGIEIRFADGVRLELIAELWPDPMKTVLSQIVCPQSLRFASYSATVTFLEQLPEREAFGGPECQVLREGAGEQLGYVDNRITLYWWKPSHCIEALKSREGRDIAHRVHPVFNEKGDEIPD